RFFADVAHLAVLAQNLLSLPKTKSPRIGGATRGSSHIGADRTPIAPDEIQEFDGHFNRLHRIRVGQCWRPFTPCPYGTGDYLQKPRGSGPAALGTNTRAAAGCPDSEVRQSLRRFRMRILESKDTGNLLNLAWFWFRSPHFGLAEKMTRTSEPPH